MIILLSIFFFILGIVIGSFLNVVILRFNTGLGINGRSGCFTCGKTLTWIELIPVLSFFMQKGRCRTCKAKLSWQYPLVELLTGFLFVGVFFKYVSPDMSVYDILSLLFYLIIWCLLVVILVYDLRHKIIPDSLVYVFSAMVFIKLLAISFFTGSFSIAELLAGPILFVPFFLLWYCSGGRWMGLGDGKLAVGIGWMLGLGYGISAIVLGFWSGAILAVGIVLFERLNSKAGRLTMKSEVPFAPFLILGIALVYFFHIDVVGVHSIFGV